MQVKSLFTQNGLPLDGPLLITPQVFGDERGFFFESWNQKKFAELLEFNGQSTSTFVQDNQSRSAQGVLRGMHYQRSPHPQSKLVRCISGEIFDVAVDLRSESPSFGKWVAVRLSDKNHHQLWVPEGFAHGFLTLSKYAEVLYKVTDFWHPSLEGSIRWNDPQLGIEWPAIENNRQPMLSQKDSVAPLLSEIQCEF